VEGNMAGEGKLLNIYWLLRQTIDRNVPGAVAELGSNQCINQIVASMPRRGAAPNSLVNICAQVVTRASRRRYCRVY
jgi:hypothetical protein